MSRFALLALLFLTAGCGKVGDPKPPLVRIPEAVNDLAVTQNGSNIVLSWTNPERYVQGANATDLAEVEIVRDGIALPREPVTGPGQLQTRNFPAGGVGVAQSFSVRIITSRGKASAASATRSVKPVVLPGAVSMARAVVDQRRIRLQWRPPEYNGALAYLVARDDGAPLPVVDETQLDDPNYEPGKRYVYTVTAAARTETGLVPAAEKVTIEVVGVDMEKPKIPAGIQVTATDAGVFLTWSPNGENDIAGYRVARAVSPDGPFAVLQELGASVSYFDPGASPGGYYSISAVDQSGNVSVPSPPAR